MASYPDVKEGAIEKKYTLKVGSKSLLLLVHDSRELVSLYIGGRTVYCINVLIYKEDSVYARVFDTSIAYLPNLYYNLNCSLEHDFKRGFDTNMILKLVQSYIKKEYPHVKYLQFNDASHRECDDGKFIDLAPMSYFTTGQTWYEKHFHAKLTPASETIFKKAIEDINKKKAAIPWEGIKQEMNGKCPLSDEELKELYEKSKTWLEFFGGIRDEIGVPTFCTFAAPWFSGFINTYLNLNIVNLKYLMPIFFDISYIIEPYASGGRKFTRKHLRDRRPRNEI